MKVINLSIVQARQILTEHPEWRETVLSEFSDGELGIEPSYPTRWEDLPSTIVGYWINESSKILSANDDISESMKMVFATKAQAQSSLAFAQLSQLAKVMNAGWEPDWENDIEVKYIIEYFKGLVVVDYTSIKSHICFKTKELAEFSLKHHEVLWKQYWMI